MQQIFADAKSKITPILSKAGNKVVHQVRGLSKLHKDDSDTDPVMDVITLAELSNLSDVSPDLQAAMNNSGDQVTQNILSERNLINPDALAYAKARSAELVTDIDDSTRGMLQDLIGDALEQNKNYNDIADLIEKSNIFSPQRAQLIATTEVRMAHGQGILAGIQRGIDAGLDLKKEWLADEDPCPECQENEDAGPIGIDEDFPSGDDSYPAHPNCECTVLTVQVNADGSNEEDEE